MAPAELGSHGSTWAQARVLLDKLGASAAERAQVATAFVHLEGRAAS